MFSFKLTIILSQPSLVSVSFMSGVELCVVYLALDPLHKFKLTLDYLSALTKYGYPVHEINFSLLSFSRNSNWIPAPRNASCNDCSNFCEAERKSPVIVKSSCRLIRNTVAVASHLPAFRQLLMIAIAIYSTNLIIGLIKNYINYRPRKRFELQLRRVLRGITIIWFIFTLLIIIYSSWPM